MAYPANFRHFKHYWVLLSNRIFSVADKAVVSPLVATGESIKKWVVSIRRWLHTFWGALNER